MAAQPTRKVSRIGIVCAGWLAASALGALAASGPFEAFPGEWSGTGTISVSGGTKERLRCRASYRVTSASARDLNLTLTCASDSYKFEFSGNVDADDRGFLTGRWTETTRSVGGTISGQGRGDRIQVLVESSGFSADIGLTTRGSQQSVVLRSRAGGETADAAITLRRQSR